MQAKQIANRYSMLFAIALTAILSGCGGGEKIVASDKAEVSVTEVPALESKQITVHFDYKKTALNPAAEQELALIVQQLKDNPSYQIELVGHTDGVASAPYNMRLSQQRVEAVRDFLAVHEIAAERMT
ncbi:MAG: OmpA family protein, partial [bacterium]|nr:OmpA family protein [bacterium]